MTTTGSTTRKPGKRATRVVENPAFQAFTRRILVAYARRVAAGDVEALRGLVVLRDDLDTVARAAVDGLRRFGYSWAEIADRLGVTRQAAQMRYGTPTDRGTLDRRLLAGMTVSLRTLVAVFIEHHPGVPATSCCPGCGYQYPAGVVDCPTNATVRPMLYRRRHEDQAAFDRLPELVRADLFLNKAARQAATRTTPTNPVRSARPPALFETAGGAR